MKNKKQQEKIYEYPFLYSNKSLFIIKIIIVILFLAIITRNSDIVLLNIFFIIYLIIGILQAPDNDNTNLSVKRSVNKIKNDGYYLVNVSLKIINNGNKNICIMIADPNYEEIGCLEINS